MFTRACRVQCPVSDQSDVDEVLQIIGCVCVWKKTPGRVHGGRHHKKRVGKHAEQFYILSTGPSMYSKVWRHWQKMIDTEYGRGYVEGRAIPDDALLLVFFTPLHLFWSPHASLVWCIHLILLILSAHLILFRPVSLLFGECRWWNLWGLATLGLDPCCFQGSL